MNGGEPPRQLPLDLEPMVGYSLDDLIVTAANAQACAFVSSWPEWPSHVAVLSGPPGSGKTHLASIWADAARAVTLDAANASVELGQRGSGSFLLEDADRADLDQTSLFHRINAVRETGSWLLLTARRFPPSWGITLPDLSSRLKAATVVEIGEPDDHLLAGVITKLFADRQVDVDPAVVQFLVRRMERSLSAANDLVARLDRAALERKSPITRSLAAEVIARRDEGQGLFDPE